jgi:hypothetical protein
MGVQLNPELWGRPQHAVVDLPAMATSLGTATTPDDYEARCRRCLYDSAYADRLRDEQTMVARDLTDASRWWRDLLDCYRQWFESLAPGSSSSTRSPRPMASR